MTANSEISYLLLNNPGSIPCLASPRVSWQDFDELTHPGEKPPQSRIMKQMCYLFSKDYSHFQARPIFRRKDMMGGPVESLHLFDQSPTFLLHMYMETRGQKKDILCKV